MEVKAGEVNGVEEKLVITEGFAMLVELVAVKVSTDGLTLNVGRDRSSWILKNKADAFLT